MDMRMCIYFAFKGNKNIILGTICPASEVNDAFKH